MICNADDGDVSACLDDIVGWDVHKTIAVSLLEYIVVVFFWIKMFFIK